MLLPFQSRKRRHARASMGSPETKSGGGYRSGLNSCLGTPEARSTASTRSGGTSSHCEIACAVIPSGAASAERPPTASIARRRASFLSLIVDNVSIACEANQALLHCGNKAPLYDVEMSLAKRIKAARLDRQLGLKALAEPFGITPQAVSLWEQDNPDRPIRPDIEKLPTLARILKVPLAWLLEGQGPPPPENDLHTLIEALPPSKRKHVRRYLQMLAEEDLPEENPLPRRRASKATLD